MASPGNIFESLVGGLEEISETSTRAKISVETLNIAPWSTAQDTGADSDWMTSSRSKTKSGSSSGRAVEIIRYSAEELYELQNPRRVFVFASKFPETNQHDSNDPLVHVNRTPISEHDALKIWEATKWEKSKRNPDGTASPDRRKGDKEAGSWERGVVAENKPGKGDAIWDDVPTGGVIESGFDLSDFASQAEKFRLETLGLQSSAGRKETDYDRQRRAEDDALEALIREENGNLDGKLVDDGEIPEWAKEDEGELTSFTADSAPLTQEVDAVGAAMKRNMLLGALNVNPNPASSQTGPIRMSNETLASTSFTSADEPKPSMEDEWHYMDPSGTIQGPYRGVDMKEWEAGGHFDSFPDLPIRHESWRGFHPLRIVYPTRENAFTVVPPEPGSQASASPQQPATPQAPPLTQLHPHMLQQSHVIGPGPGPATHFVGPDGQPRSSQQHMTWMLQQVTSQQEAMMRQQQQLQLQLQQNAHNPQVQHQIQMEMQRIQQQIIAASSMQQNLQMNLQQQDRLQRQQHEDQLRQQQEAAHRQQQMQVTAQKQREEQARINLLVQQEHQRQIEVEARKKDELTEQENTRKQGDSPSAVSSTGATAINSSQKLGADSNEKVKGKTSTTKLKSLLGVGGKAEGSEPKTNTAVKEPSRAGWNKKEEASKPKDKISLRAIQENEKVISKAKAEEMAKLAKEKHPKLSPSGWGGSTPTATTSGNDKKSLKEIMEMEERTAEKGRATSETPKLATNSWAAKISGGGGLAMPVKQSAQQPHRPPANHVTSSTSVQQTTVAPAPAPVPAPALASSGTTQTKSSDSGFGHSLQPEFAEWCKLQLKKITNNADLTLVQFCVTLTSAVEIRETIAATLGSTPQVAQFATEFIRRKDISSAPIQSKGGSNGNGNNSSGFQKAGKKKGSGGKGK
jgi:hypothetical protein